MIHYSTVFDLHKNIGVAYNNTMKLLGQDDWCCFIDGDAMFLHPDFGWQINNYVNKYPDCGLFTCKTNRVNTPYMLAGDWWSNDIEYHRNVAKELQLDQSVTDITKFSLEWPLAGVLMLISQRAWAKVGGFRKHGILGVDRDMHRKITSAGFKVLMMNGVYIYHWYRGGDPLDISHLV